jgi:hypothetical protein
MRGEQDSQIELLTTTSPGKRVPATHPIREIKRLADQALAKLDPVFDAMYSSIDRPSIPPERLLKAQLLLALHSVRTKLQGHRRTWDGSYLIMPRTTSHG